LVAWGAELASAGTRPGLCLFAPNDPFVRGHDLATQVAAQLGAEVVELADQGHWWMLGAPALGAEVLSDFWARHG
jgi:predicted alpha/beta hydrolase family esterase